MGEVVEAGSAAQSEAEVSGSVYALLRPTPRIFVLSAVSLVIAATVSGREVARYKYAVEALGDASGLGIIGVVFSLTMAAVSLGFGRFVEVIDARRLVVFALVTGAVVTTVTAVVVSRGRVPVWFLVVTAIADGMYVGVLLPAYSKVQAAIVRPDARGAAEMLNILRSGIGGLLGATAAGLLDSEAAVLAVCAVLAAATAAATAVIIRPVRLPASRRRAERTGEILSAVRANPQLLAVVKVDLIFSFVMPTQFVALILANGGLDHLVSVASFSALLGVLVGRLVLNLVGFRGEPRRNLRIAYGGFLALTVIGTVLLIDDYILTRVRLLEIMIFSGSAVLVYAQGLVSSLIQQRVPESIRGGLSGSLNGLRFLLVATSSALTAWVAVAGSAIELTLVTGALLFGGLVVARGFRGVHDRAVVAENAPSAS